MANHFHTLKVKELNKETFNSVSIVLDVPAELKSDFEYEAGQYLTLKAQIGNEEVRRSYSISSYSKVDNKLQVSCKLIEGGKMSTYLCKEIGVGQTIEAMVPMGNFILSSTHQDLVLFAAGSGITPIISIIKKALTEGDNTVNLYYGNRATNEIMFNKELMKLQDEYTNRLLVQHFLSSDGERLDAERTTSIVNGLGEAKQGANYYVCGPEGMIAAVKLGLENAQIAKDKINIEYFASPKTEKTKTEVVASGDINEVHATIDGESYTFTLEEGESILDAANRIGIDPPFSCQSGVCTTCKCKVLSGAVEMENNFGLGEDEEEEGYVLSCISKPITAGVKVSWDDV